MADANRTYQQPRRINVVSVTLIVLLLGAAQLAYSSWPVIVLNADLKNVLEEALPRLYRANLLPEPESTTASEDVRQALIEKLKALGVADPEAAMTITRDEHIVALGAKVDTAIDVNVLGLVHKKIPVTLRPRVETSAARVSY